MDYLSAFVFVFVFADADANANANANADADPVTPAHLSTSTYAYFPKWQKRVFAHSQNEKPDDWHLKKRRKKNVRLKLARY
ncbi:hypothetical protein POVWA1_038130 [Plasmodium ovale wallikeri]|uniref:Secreted protein n=1 Tax=Plasmodium ovale wallikeri TaxID=864142 RepID=A0A1A8Z3R9_PLAOA|nr:hypothetical protein POVWA1_038130 [Plasmodium ovale wallikeri]